MHLISFEDIFYLFVAGTTKQKWTANRGREWQPRMATANGHEQETRMETKGHKEQDEPRMAGRLPPTIDKA